MSKQWMSSSCLRAAPTGEINEQKGIIEGVSVCTVGEAEGHGVNLDSEFIHTVAELGNEKSHGLKARFGHPNMCSTALGTFLGRFKNFRKGTTLREGKEAEAVIADLFLSNEARETPQGDLHSYVTGMAKNEPDMFGTSIVFTPGATYRRTAKGEKLYEHELDAVAEGDEVLDPVYVECEALHACDAVDEPAANDGLFSAFTGETMAGQITEFLDLHPQVWDAIEKNPSVLEALGRYADKVDEFVARYKNSQTAKKGSAMFEKKKHAEKLEEEVKVEEEAKTAEPVAEEAAPVTEPEAVPETPAEEAVPEAEEEKSEESDALSREEFARIADKFGDSVAAKVMREGGDYNTALELSHDALKEENEKLRAASGSVGTPAKVVEEKEKKALFATGK